MPFLLPLACILVAKRQVMHHDVPRHSVVAAAAAARRSSMRSWALCTAASPPSTTSPTLRPLWMHPTQRRAICGAPGKPMHEATSCWDEACCAAPEWNDSKASCLHSTVRCVPCIAPHTCADQHGGGSGEGGVPLLKLRVCCLVLCRSALMSLAPTSTGSATAIALIFPELKGKLNGLAVRVPLTNSSITDCVFEVCA